MKLVHGEHWEVPEGVHGWEIKRTVAVNLCTGEFYVRRPRGICPGHISQENVRRKETMERK